MYTKGIDKMKRFYYSHHNYWRRVLLSVLVFILLLLAFSIGTSAIFRETASKQTEHLYLAITRSIAHCYASHGYYPENLEYLQSHYGIYYDTDQYFIDYQVLGENIFPEVTIIEK